MTFGLDVLVTGDVQRPSPRKENQESFCLAGARSKGEGWGTSSFTRNSDHVVRTEALRILGSPEPWA